MILIHFLEADADAKQTRETGKVSTNSKKMAGLPFTQSQLTKFYAFSDSVQNDLLDMKVEDAMRLMDLDKFQENQAIEGLFRHYPGSDFGNGGCSIDLIVGCKF